MALKDYVIPTRTVRIDDKTDFTVRGLSFEDVTKLVNLHGPVLALVYGRFTEEKDQHGLRPEVIGGLIQSVIHEFPDAVADMIAIAAEEQDQVKTIRRLPIGVQLEAIEGIIALTFIGEAEVKNLVETVTRMAQGVTAVVADLTKKPEASLNGGGAFADR